MCSVCLVELSRCLACYVMQRMCSHAPAPPGSEQPWLGSSLPPPVRPFLQQRYGRLLAIPACSKDTTSFSPIHRCDPSTCFEIIMTTSRQRANKVSLVASYSYNFLDIGLQQLVFLFQLRRIAVNDHTQLFPLAFEFLHT